MENTLDQEFYQYYTQLNKEQKKSMLQFVKSFLKSGKQNSKRITVEQYNLELEESERQIEAGHFTSQEDLEKEMQKW